MSGSLHTISTGHENRLTDVQEPPEQTPVDSVTIAGVVDTSVHGFSAHSFSSSQ